MTANWSRAAIMALLAVLSTSASGQPAPFDMSPERPAASPQSQPEVSIHQDRKSVPDNNTPQAIPLARPPRLATPESSIPMDQAAPPPTAVRSSTPNAGEPDLVLPNVKTVADARSNASEKSFRRYIIPMKEFALSGETAARAWSLFLSPEQAKSKSVLRVTYQNAILVAPEHSRLQISINGKSVLDEPVSSPESLKSVTADLPAGLMREGANTIEFRTELRHRTDCSIQSTYDLWTDINPSETYLNFEDEDALDLHRVDDIRAVGLDAEGRTKFNIVSPIDDFTSATPSLVRLAEGLSLLARMPNQTTTISSTILSAEGDGILTTLVGPADKLRLLGAPISEPSGPSTEFVRMTGKDKRSLFVVTGQNWSDVNIAISNLVALSDRPRTQQREAISQPSWRVPDAPMFRGEKSVSFADLGLQTQEFSGRRFHVDFTIAVPADFYAQAYGKMTLLLDAGYTEAVLPGSHLDVFVNGNIATTVPIGGSGAILQKSPIPVTMRHLRPGINEISLEANLLTDADAACLPGMNGGDDRRFVLFDTSQLQIPDFARISTVPNLSALRGLGYPYNRADDPVPLLLAESGPEIASVAATVMGQLSVVAERAIPFSTKATPFSVANKNAIFIGALAQTPGGVLDQVGIARNAKNVWGQLTAQTVANSTDDAISRWRDQLGGGGWQHPFVSLKAWLNSKFNLSLGDLRIVSQTQDVFMPSAASTLILAQGAGATTEAVWTLVSSPNVGDLISGVDALTTHSGWSQLGGRVTAYTPSTDSYTQAALGPQTLVQSQPLTIRNLRLIAANWLSENVLSYAALLALSALLLGIATTALTSVLGRRE